MRGWPYWNTSSTAAIDKLTSEVAGLRSQGHRVVVVTSGAIAAGLPALGMSGARPTDVATLQAISAVGQSRLMAAYDAALARHGRSEEGARKAGLPDRARGR